MPQFDVYFDGTSVGRRLEPDGESRITLKDLKTDEIKKLLRVKDESAKVESTDGSATPSFLAAWDFICINARTKKKVVINGNSTTFGPAERTANNFYCLEKMNEVYQKFTFEVVPK